MSDTPVPTSSESSSAEAAVKESLAELRGIHSASFPPLLQQLGISLLISTYQAGKLLVVRADGDGLNTLCRDFEAPMGIAARPNELMIGTMHHVWNFHSHHIPALLKPQGRYDACFLPRLTFVTGNIQGHEMAWGGPELWIVNTRFSCLCTLNGQHSFLPRWRPPFITELASDDRCHLNGLGMRDERPRYVTCLGMTDTSGGWRTEKARGGCLLDVATGAVVAQGLSMPHSPRWHMDRLWLLESGQGSLAVVDEAAGRLQTVAYLPGFTRGLDFYGPIAFIGLSQVRDSAVFSGIPLTERLEERVCGVWVVDVTSGQTIAFLKFEGVVQEIFAVQILPGVCFPELVTEDKTIIGNSFLLP
jgi:uncharacterized protein (TIGR03032 family)